MHRENIHQIHPYYYNTSMSTHPPLRMQPHSHHKVPPHLYPSITPQQLCLCLCCTSTPMYAPGLVQHYPHITPLVYPQISSSRIPFYVLPPHSKKIWMNPEVWGVIEYPTNRIIKEDFQWVEEMKLIVNVFLHLLMNHMKSWDMAKVVVFVGLKKPHCWFNWNLQL